MSGNAKFRWFLLAPIVVALLVVATSPVSWAGELEDAQERVRQNPNDAGAHFDLGSTYDNAGQYQNAIASYKEAIRINPIHPKIEAVHFGLGLSYGKSGQYQDAIASLKKAIRIQPDYADAHHSLGIVYALLGQHQDAIASYKEAIRIKPGYADAHWGLGVTYKRLGQHQDAIASYKEAIRIKPNNADAHNGLGYSYAESGQYKEAIASYKEALRIDPNHTLALNNLNKLEQKIEAKRLARERKLLEEERKKLEALRLAEENRQRQQQAQAEKEPPPRKEQTPQSGTGSGFFISKMGHVITNAHVVQNCNKVTIGDNANKQVPAEIINTDRSNDLALLKLSTLEMASAESKSLIQKLSIVVVPLSSKGLLRSDDVRLGEKVLVAGYPFGELFSNTIKVTSGIVSATRGAGDDSGQFQLDAAVQPGNSGGPIYDSGGNIVGVVIAQLDKLKMAKAIGTLPENVNFGIKASTVRQFLTSSGLPSKKSERTEEKSTQQLAEIAKNQALMVMCLQTESFEQTAESIAEERKKLKKERERIAALQNLQEEKQKLEEERRLFKEEQGRLARLQPKKRITFPPEYNQALHSYRSGNYDECILRLQSVLSANPPERLKDNINYWIGSCYSKLEMYEDAIEILQSVLLKNPPAELRNKILKRLNEIQH